ncbi:hypothetical protein [Paraburkholderia tropica]|uniref:hypothetical protein n=1 Tax=Paraburkholderia tropica TaxID=92647 RepID=UPI002ABE2845|nr:hypothetical protein [Paraburkholderia tropica]
MADAADHLAALLPIPLHDAMTVAAMEPSCGQLLLSVGLPLSAAHLDPNLPKKVDGVPVIYSFAEPEELD